MQLRTPDRLGAFEYRRHPARLPALRDGREATRHRVVVAGGGPVGLAVALGLARLGVPSLVVEADETVCVGSRAICLSRRSLEILDRLGVLPAFVDKGLAWTGGRSFWRDTEVLRFLMPHDADQRLAPMTNIEQYYIEQFLLDGIAKHPELVEVRWGTSVLAVSAGDHGVELALEAAGRRYAVHADWLVACDGARSLVRDQLGLKMSGTSYEGRYVIADIEADLGLPTERLAWFDPPANPGRTVLMHRQPDDLWRIDYQLRPDEDPDEAVRPENVLPVIRAQLAMLGFTGDWKAIWISMYRASAVSLERYRHGRVLFAGDAAHLVPIFGVRGLNSGFEDAWNLAWKLARAAGGNGARGGLPPGGSERLLDSYSLERRHAWRQNIAQATKSTEFMAPPSRGFELMRDAVLSLAAGHPALRSLINPRQSSSIPYPDSPLNTPDRPGEFGASAGAPGEALAECPLRDAAGAVVHLTQLPGDGFTLLCYGGGAGPAGDAARILADSPPGCGLAVVTIAPAGGEGTAAADAVDASGRFAALYDARPGSAWLLRPDGNVCARWRAIDAQAVIAALARALGSPAAGPAQPALTG
ncbi:FAD-dependent monooxygenase [Burkholderiaceae bacterium FT117]|uniref:FAD-dependent monooxygenase n=1 Tax=Zeimonas sediminis TaxID=2944268 RepID=UPI002342E699|nr:FAD-dependent monooxygenase [Zeimonas sediminis]MCM5572255.1 FAD-dependent monooxygenase [Zeimonas sediminis]